MLQVLRYQAVVAPDDWRTWCGLLRIRRMSVIPRAAGESRSSSPREIRKTYASLSPRERAGNGSFAHPACCGMCPKCASADLAAGVYPGAHFAALNDTACSSATNHRWRSCEGEHIRLIQPRDRRGLRGNTNGCRGIGPRQLQACTLRGRDTVRKRCVAVAKAGAAVVGFALV